MSGAVFMAWMHNRRVFLLYGIILAILKDASPGRYRRQAISKRQYLWPDAIIPFTLGPEFNGREERDILKAMKEWETFTCVRFVQANSSIKIKLNIVRQASRCESDLGGGKGKHKMNLGKSCMSHSTLLHELGHAIGLHHEQDRPDRDKFVSIRPWNIPVENERFFKIEEKATTFDLPYSYRSVMHYEKTDMANPGSLSLEAMDSKNTDIMGRAQHLAFRDAQLVNRLYECDDCYQEEECPADGFFGPDCRCWCPSLDYTAVDCVTKEAIDSNRVIYEKGKILVDREHQQTYFASLNKADWFDASRKCSSMGGWLLSMDKQKMNDRLYTVFHHLLKGRFRLEKDIFWTSGNDIDREGTFVWGNGQRLDFLKLARNFDEPNDGWGTNEDCVAVSPNPHFKQNLYKDWDCGLRLRYICGLPHMGCYDRSPTCPYYRQTHQCDIYADKCRKSCGICGKVDEEIKKPKKAKTKMPTVCHQLECTSRLTSRLVRNTTFGQDICVQCPECLCMRRLYGFGIYPSYARICCGILQMTGTKTEGIHIITHQPGRLTYVGGRRNGITSRKATFSRRAFTVKGYEPIGERPNACIRFKCYSSPIRSRTFRGLLPGSKFCIQCPACRCEEMANSVFGDKIYHRKSSACCAAAHALGKKDGGFFSVKKVLGVSSYNTSIRFGVLSKSTLAHDDWAFKILSL